MSRFRRAVLPAALLLALAAAPATAHEGDPNFSSVVREIVPPTEGLTARVLDHDDALLVVNRSGRTVVILDEDREPFARLLADGTVQVDAEWAAEQAAAEEAEDAQGGDETGASAAPPAGSRDGALLASADGALLAHGGEDHDDSSGKGRGRGRDERETIAWTTLDRTGRFQWHDERIKYREPGVPPQVRDTTERTEIEDWRVPIRVAGTGGAILGTLTWVGEPDAGSGFPTAAVVSLVVIALGAIGLVVAVRRNRRAGAGGDA